MKSMYALQSVISICGLALLAWLFRRLARERLEKPPYAGHVPPRPLPPPGVDDVMRERAMLIGRKRSHGLTADEVARLDWLNAEALRLCPVVTPEMTAALEAVHQRLDAMQARRKTPNV